MARKKKPSLPKPRIPLPRQRHKVHPDERKEDSRARARRRVDPDKEDQ